MKNKILLYLVYHDERLFVGKAFQSIIKNFDCVNFDVIVVDTSINEIDSKILQENIPHGIEIIRYPGILTNVINFIFEKYLPLYEYIIRLDADDVLQDNAISLLFEEMENDKNISAAYGNWYVIDNIGRELKQIAAPDPKSFQGFHGACTMLRTSSLKEFSMKNLNIQAQDGFAIYMHLIFTRQKISYLNKAIFKYRRHETNLSSNKQKLWNARLQILRYFCKGFDLNMAILVDTDWKSLGSEDLKFIQKTADICTVSNGFYSQSGGISKRIPDRILQDFFEKEFAGTNTSAVVINMKKLSNKYLDGLIELICLFGKFTKAYHVHFACSMDMPTWIFEDQSFLCINDNLVNKKVDAVKSTFVKIAGINYYNYSYFNQQTNFIMTDNFLTTIVDSNG